MYSDIIKKLKREAVPLAVLCIAVFLTALTLRHLIIPTYLELKAGRLELKDYLNMISSENGYQTIKNEIMEKTRLLQNRVDTIAGTSNESRDLSSFLELLISKARASDIRFVKMQPQAETRNEDFQFFPVLLEVTTTYHALGQFLSSLEKLPHMFRVDRLALEALSESSIDGKILITCFIPITGKL